MKVTRLLTLPAALLIAGGAQAQQPTPSEEQVHVVRPGDTLWDLARLYLSNPFRWPEIFSVNAPPIADPHWIYPQARLLIPGVQSPPPPGFQPALSLSNGAPGAQPPLLPSVFSRNPSVVNESSASLVPMTRVDEAPLVQPGALLGAGLLLPASELGALGEIRDVISPTVLPGGVRPQINLFDKVLATVSPAVEEGSRVQFMRPERRVRPYGRIHLSTGTGEVLSVTDGVATIEVDHVYHRIGIGDLAVAMPEFPATVGALVRIDESLIGEILAMELEQPAPSIDDRVFLSLGSASGVKVGDEFVAYLEPVRERWGTRPAVDVGRLQVVRVTELTSTARVVGLEQPALEPGLPVRLVAGLP